MSYIYKLVTNNDLEDIVSLDKLMRQEEPGIFNEYNEQSYRDNWEKHLIESNPTSDVLICLNNNDIVGRVDLMYEKSYMDFSTVGYIDWIYTRPSYRGRGIGKQLLKEAEKVFKEKGCSKYYLFIADNEQTVSFYDSTDLHISTMKTGEKKFK